VGKSAEVDEAINTLAYRVVGGIYPPGQLLPSVRQVAAEFALSVPTANVVLRELAASGLADARQGLGYVVRDVRLYGGIETWRVIFKFSRQVPDLAAKIFEDIVQTEHMMLTAGVRIILAESGTRDSTAVRAAVDQFEFLAGAPEQDPPQLLRAELHIMRMLAAACGQTVFLGICNSVGEMLVELPEVAEAFYVVPPAAHLFAWRGLLALWDSGQRPPDLAPFEQGLDDYKRAVADHFRTLLSTRATPTPTDVLR
jgi:GntR family transcriptional regulator, transcriptional repressor for pyruvate dehydrogenase complex